MKSFRLFWKAVRSTRHEMWVSVQVLVAVTIVLSLLLYIVEHHAQPDVFRNYWDATKIAANVKKGWEEVK